MRAADVTVILPTFNRATALAAVWESYTAATGVSKIVVVDDGSTDDTPHTIERLIKASPIPVELIRHKRRRGQPAARLSGLTATEGHWVLFGEDDVYLAPEYINVLRLVADARGADAIAGRLINVRIDGPFNSSKLPHNDLGQRCDTPFHIKSFRANFNADLPGPVSAPFLHSVALIRRSVFDAVTFDTRYRGTAHREDTDFYIGASRCGFRLLFTSETKCYHLRGALSFTGGNRGKQLNWIRIEFWGLVNTYLFVRKHWLYLTHRYAFEGTPFRYILTQYARDRVREFRQKVLKGRQPGMWTLFGGPEKGKP